MEELEDLTLDVEDEGQLFRRELDRVVIARGAWATVMFLYEERDPRAEGEVWREPRVALVRLRKVHGLWRRHATVTIAGAEQAHAVLDTLAKWFPR